MTSDEKTNYVNPEACTPTDQPALKSGTQPVKFHVQIDPELGKKLNKCKYLECYALEICRCKET